MGQKHSSYHCDTELVIYAAKELEAMLEVHFGAQGRGLHEKISAVSRNLPPDLVRRMRFLATIRNKLVHERGFTQIPDRASFVVAFDASVAELQAILKSQQQGAGKKAGGCVVM